MKRPCLVFAFCVFLAGCHHKPATVATAPPPPIQTKRPSSESASATHQTPTLELPIEVSPDTKPLLVETGIASWYGPPYHNRRASNGEIYDMNALTAAHRTLPLGTVVRVTNLTTQHSAVVRITDRGPFIPGRIIDLSMAAAKAVDVWRPGLAKVRVEVLQAPAAIDHGGRWGIQIGAFGEQEIASEVRDHLMHRYHTAKVAAFPSPTGNWW